LTAGFNKEAGLHMSITKVWTIPKAFLPGLFGVTPLGK
jgi:hypothetical protein